MVERRQFVSWAAFIGAALATTLFVRDPYISSVISLVAIGATLAVSLRFVMLMGELNFATAAFYGIGAYSTAISVTILEWPFPISLLIGGVIAGIVSLAFGYITLRTKGPYFLLIGFAFTEAVRIIYSKALVIGGNSGIVGIFPPVAFDPWMPTLVMAVAVLLIFGLYILERSDFGRILLAVRDNENVARSVGINVLLCKIACFACASFVAGVAGSLHAFVNNVISPNDFGYLVAAFALAYVKVGGEGTIAGPVIGAIILVSLGSYALGFGGQEHIFYGGAIVLAVLLMPEGLAGLARRSWPFAMRTSK